MKIAVVGSRTGIKQEVVVSWLQKNVLPHDIIITGGAIGVDTYALDWCRDHNVSCVIIKPADLSRKGDYLLRNHFIVDLAEKIVAFHFNESKGTAHTIQYAFLKNKKVEVIHG